MNYRSRPEVLAVVNHLFRGDFGDEFQPLTASGEFPDPVFGPPVELLVTDKSSYAETEVHWRRGEARGDCAHVFANLLDEGVATPAEIVLLFAAGYRRGVVRGGAHALSACRRIASTGRGYLASSKSSTCSHICGSCETGTTTRRSLSVLASPLVGISNDALVLLRRAATRRPAVRSLERRVAGDAAGA